MIPDDRTAAAAPPRRLVLVLVAVLVPVFTSCTKHDSLVLLDLRSSGPLGAPVARIRLSAPGWENRTITGGIGPEGFRVGYYGPSDGGAVSVTAEARDGVDCVLGRGSATVPMLASGGTSEPLTLFVRPLPASGCAVVGGNDAGTDDAGGEDAGTDDAGEEDAGTVDAGGDAGNDDAGGDAGSDDAGATTDAADDTTAD